MKSNKSLNSDTILSTIIVTWQSGDYIEECLESLTSSTSKIKSQVIVVDNNSKDNTCKIIKDKFPEVKLIRQKKNWGFGQGNNIGLGLATGKYILLLNPDTKVNKNAIYTMIRFLEANRKVGAVGPEQINKEGKVIATLTHTSLKSFSHLLLRKIASTTGKKYKIIYRKPLETKLLNLGVVMLKRKVFDQGIRFDPKLFLYGEEGDFFPRISKADWKIYFLQNIYVYHYREKSIAQTGKKYTFAVESGVHLLKKNTKKFISKYNRRGSEYENVPQS